MLQVEQAAKRSATFVQGPSQAEAFKQLEYTLALSQFPTAYIQITFSGFKRVRSVRHAPAHGAREEGSVHPPAQPLFSPVAQMVIDCLESSQYLSKVKVLDGSKAWNVVTYVQRHANVLDLFVTLTYSHRIDCRPLFSTTASQICPPLLQSCSGKLELCPSLL